MLVVEGGEQPWYVEAVGGDRGEGSDVEVAAQQSGELVDSELSTSGRGERCPGVGQRGGAGFGQAYRARCPVE